MKPTEEEDISLKETMFPKATGSAVLRLTQSLEAYSNNPFAIAERATNLMGSNNGSFKWYGLEQYEKTGIDELSITFHLNKARQRLIELSSNFTSNSNPNLRMIHGINIPGEEAIATPAEVIITNPLKKYVPLPSDTEKAVTNVQDAQEKLRKEIQEFDDGLGLDDPPAYIDLPIPPDNLHLELFPAENQNESPQSGQSGQSGQSDLIAEVEGIAHIPSTQIIPQSEGDGLTIKVANPDLDAMIAKLRADKAKQNNQ